MKWLKGTLVEHKPSGKVGIVNRYEVYTDKLVVVVMNKQGKRRHALYSASSCKETTYEKWAEFIRDKIKYEV